MKINKNKEFKDQYQSAAINIKKVHVLIPKFLNILISKILFFSVSLCVKSTWHTVSFYKMIKTKFFPKQSDQCQTKKCMVECQNPVKVDGPITHLSLQSLCFFFFFFLLSHMFPRQCSSKLTHRFLGSSAMDSSHLCVSATSPAQTPTTPLSLPLLISPPFTDSDATPSIRSQLQ